MSRSPEKQPFLGSPPNLGPASRSESAPASGAASHSSGSAARSASGSRIDLQRIVSSEDPTRVSGSALLPAGVSATDDTTRIEGYEIEEELHRGGQGVVYRAEQLSTKRIVALKVLLEGPYATDTAKRRFEREVELAASLNHPNIVTILDSGKSFGRFYFAMEYVEGLRLDRYLAQMRPPLLETVQLFTRVCDAVNYAHQRGVIHRDLKPSNILIDAAGQPHILDFGLAKESTRTDGDETVQMLSLTGQLVGTVAYMSPEQARGEQDVDVRSDVYSLGVVFYEAALGQAPYVVNGPLGEVLQNIARREPTDPLLLRGKSRFGRQIGDEISTILLKSLEKDRARRYQTAGELSRDLKHFIAGEPIEAKRASRLYMLRKTLSRYRIEAAAAGTILLTIIASIAMLAFSYNKQVMTSAELASQKQLAETRAREAANARNAEADARRAAEDAADKAVEAQAGLRRAVAQARVERGNFAIARGGVLEGRDSFWQARRDDDGPAARWALRQYYLSSGDEQATLLYHTRNGLLSVASQAGYAAVCESADAITVRELGTSRTKNWFLTPSPPTALRMTDGGRVLAAGRGWVRGWSVDRPLPSLSLTLPSDVDASDVFAWADDRFVVVLNGDILESYDADSGAQLGTLELPSAATGQLAADSLRRRLIVPTEGGLLMAELLENGQLISRALTYSTNNMTPRAVRFLGADQVAFIADGLYQGDIPAAGLLRTELLEGTSDPWDFLDVAPESQYAAVARRSGQIALFKRGAEAKTWQATLGTLDGIWFSRDRQALATLSSDGTVTYWSPPDNREPERDFLKSPVAAWTSSADRRAVLISDDRGTLFVHAPHTRPTLLRIGAQRFFSFPLGTPDIVMALSGNGRRAFVRNGGTARMIDFDERFEQPRERPFAFSELKPLASAIDHAGETLAIYARESTGIQQTLSLYGLDDAEDRTGPTDWEARCSARFSLMGSEVRFLRFLRDGQLLLARSDGRLYLIGSRDRLRAAGSQPVELPKAADWFNLGVPPTALAVSADGTLLAAGGEDGTLRIIRVSDGTIACRARLATVARSLEFSATGEALFVRGDGDELAVYDTVDAVRIATIAAPAATSGVDGALCVGDTDRLLVSSGAGVIEFDYSKVDRVVEQNRGYATRRGVQEALLADDYRGAWRLATDLGKRDPSGAFEERVLLIEALLRSSDAAPDPEWIASIEPLLTAPLLLRLGHAAYNGGQFAEALRWLEAAYDTQAGHADARTERRLAEAYYLGEQYDDAARLFAEVRARSDLPDDWLATLALEHAAAELFAGRLANAQKIVAQIGQSESGALSGGPAARSASTIGGLLVGTNTETIVSQALEAAMDLWAEAFRPYRDDEHFFRGELARAGGDAQTARAQYQLCIDAGEDVWPANWARYRIRQMISRTEEP